MLDDVVGHLLYVEDDPAVQRSTVRWLERGPYPLRVASTCTQARKLASREALWCGFIVDQRLPDGEGFDLLRELHEHHPGVPAVVGTGILCRKLANACSQYGIKYVVKPFGVDELASFFADVSRFQRGLSAAGKSIRLLAHDIHATTREAEVLRLAVDHGCTNQEIADALGISLNTVKTHVRTVLAKAQAPSLGSL